MAHRFPEGFLWGGAPCNPLEEGEPLSLRLVKAFLAGSRYDYAPLRLRRRRKPPDRADLTERLVFAPRFQRFHDSTVGNGLHENAFRAFRGNR